MTNHVLKHEGRLLSSLLEKVADLKELNRIFSLYLEPDIAQHCQVTKIDRDCLIVLVDSNHWVTQLRFYIPDLLPQLRSHPPFEKLKAICAKVKPQYNRAKSSSRSRTVKLLSKEASEKILETAKDIKDEKLRRALEKIAKNCVS